MIRRHLIALAFVSLSGLGAAGAALAADTQPFTRPAFEAAQAQGRPILVSVHADWCPTCRAQAPIVSSVIGKPEFDRLVVFKLDFDDQKEEWSRLGVRMQSTLIAYNGKQERARSAGQTDPAAISQLITASLR